MMVEFISIAVVIASVYTHTLLVVLPRIVTMALNVSFLLKYALPVMRTEILNAYHGFVTAAKKSSRCHLVGNNRPYRVRVYRFVNKESSRYGKLPAYTLLLSKARTRMALVVEIDMGPEYNRLVPDTVLVGIAPLVV